MLLLSLLFPKAHGIPSVRNYNLKTDLDWSSNHSDVTPQQLFELVTRTPEELFAGVRIRTFHSEGDRYSFSVNMSSAASVQVQTHRNFGRCYTLLPEERIRRLGVYYIKLSL